MSDNSVAGTPRKLIWVAAEASLVPGPGETVTRAPASAAETLSAAGTQLGPATVALLAPSAPAPEVLAPSGLTPAPSATTAAAPTAVTPAASAKPARDARVLRWLDLSPSQ